MSIVPDSINPINEQNEKLGARPGERVMRGCEADGMKLENYPAYVREWIDREKDGENDEPALL